MADHKVIHRNNKRVREDSDQSHDDHGHVKTVKKRECQILPDRFERLISDLQCMVCAYLEPIEIECLPLSYTTSKIQKMQQKRLRKRLEQELHLDSTHLSDFWTAFDLDQTVWTGSSLLRALQSIDYKESTDHGRDVDFFVGNQSSDLALSRFLKSICKYVSINSSDTDYCGVTKLVRIESYLYKTRNIQLIVADTKDIVDYCIDEFDLTLVCNFWKSSQLVTLCPTDVLRNVVRPNQSFIENLHRQFSRPGFLFVDRVFAQDGLRASIVNRILNRLNARASRYGGGSRMCYTVRVQCGHLRFNGLSLCQCYK